MRWLLNRFAALSEITGHPLNRGKAFKAVRRYLLWNFGRRAIDADFVMPLTDDIRIILSNDENYATLAYTERLWDFADMLFLLHVLKETDLFVDVGSNVGAYSLLASGGPGARSIAFEPVPGTHQKLLGNIGLNGLNDLIEARNQGVGAEAGELEFTTGLGGLNHVARPEGGNVFDTEVVKVVRLDDVLAGTAPCVLKLDVEGYEHAVLEGAAGILKSPALLGIIIEMNDSGIRYGYQDSDVHALLSEEGFVPCAYDPMTRSLDERETHASTANGFNTIYCRKPALAEIRARLENGRRYSIEGKSY